MAFPGGGHPKTRKKTPWRGWQGGAVTGPCCSPPVMKFHGLIHYRSGFINGWLVVSTPLKNISQLGLLFPTIGENKKCSKPPTRWEFQDPKSTTCLAKFWVYIPLHSPYIGLIYGRYSDLRT